LLLKPLLEAFPLLDRLLKIGALLQEFLGTLGILP
jgi:hypothetical protein